MPNRDPDLAVVVERPLGRMVHACTDENLLDVIERLLPVVPLDATWHVERRS